MFVEIRCIGQPGEFLTPAAEVADQVVHVLGGDIFCREFDSRGHLDDLWLWKVRGSHRGRPLAWPDHTNTKDEYGPFYPFLIDGAIQAMSHAIVGTDRSTVSGIAAKRIESWQGGLAYFVRWGRPGADDENDPEYQVRLHALEE
ncbi:hypothetical protein HMN09_01278100 [Mycena chlorophos]|uniref:Uncharacterized protein n=1 Tax=Mycena chlorophos TaxID=658473 RepID=A0A8H6S213_MYCCL|nr:hypothetical protein HMN09_01278100 [Mycena chlorophos]